MKLISSLLLTVGFCATLSGVAQDPMTITKALSGIKKGSYAILELRLNKEDEFRTIEGSSSSVTRISLFTGANNDKQVITKKFAGFNDMANYLNEAGKLGWKLKSTYRMNGESLLIVHYVLYKRK